MKPQQIRIITPEECPLTSFFDKEVWEVIPSKDDPNTITLVKKEKVETAHT